jgi:hypothetical protein
MASKETVVALASGYYGVNGESVLVKEGDVYRADDPVVKKFPKAFGPQRTESDRVEQATAAPGEKRG